MPATQRSAPTRSAPSSPLFETLPDIAGRTITAGALLSQRARARYLLGRGADYLYPLKGNQPTVHDDIQLLLDESIAQRAPDFTVQSAKPEQGRRERRAIRTSGELNGYLNFPGVGQVFAVRRETVEVKSAKRRSETAFGVTSLTPQAASPERLLTLYRGYWMIEAMHHILDWSFDEDRSRIRTGHGPEHMTQLRRFAIDLIHGRRLGVAETMRNLSKNPRRVLDFLNMTANARPRAAPAWPPLRVAPIPSTAAGPSARRPRPAVSTSRRRRWSSHTSCSRRTSPSRNCSVASMSGQDMATRSAVTVSRRKFPLSVNQTKASTAVCSSTTIALRTNSDWTNSSCARSQARRSAQISADGSFRSA